MSAENATKVDGAVFDENREYAAAVIAAVLDVPRERRGDVLALVCRVGCDTMWTYKQEAR